jgi:hypothetical protein
MMNRIQIGKVSEALADPYGDLVAFDPSNGEFYGTADWRSANRKRATNIPARRKTISARYSG